MNTKLLFYCTHTQYGSFEKVIFETVLAGQIEDIDEAKEWLDLQIPSLFDEFDFSLVFDWIIIGYESTDLEVSDTKIISSKKGELVFDTPKKVRKSRTVKTKVETKAKVEPEVKKKREYQSVWINPSGETFKVGFACHNEFAYHWLKLNDKKLYHKADTKYSHKYYYEILEDIGWARILGWTDPPTFSLPSTIGVKLKSAIREYCLSQKLDYIHFPEILKS